jgi:hypothetical protein
MADPIAVARKLSTKVLKPLHRVNDLKHSNSGRRHPIQDLESAKSRVKKSPSSFTPRNDGGDFVSVPALG